MTVDAEFEERLTAWLRSQLPGSDDVHVEGLDRVSFGHSAEMLMLTVVTRDGPRQTRQDVVLRLRPSRPRCWSPTTSRANSASFAHCRTPRSACRGHCGWRRPARCWAGRSS